jgi:hypothetical protein
MLRELWIELRHRDVCIKHSFQVMSSTVRARPTSLLDAALARTFGSPLGERSAELDADVAVVDSSSAARYCCTLQQPWHTV